MNTTSTPQHKIGETIAYHLLPGIVILASYLAITPLLRKNGLPSVMSLWLISLVVLVPLEMGILYWQGKKRNGRFSLEGMVLDRIPLSKIARNIASGIKAKSTSNPPSNKTRRSIELPSSVLSMKVT